jgi:hypothetical protein
VFIERIIYANGNGVCFSPMEQVCDVERERGIALAPVFPGHLAINPTGRGCPRPCLLPIYRLWLGASQVWNRPHWHWPNRLTST